MEEFGYNGQWKYILYFSRRTNGGIQNKAEAWNHISYVLTTYVCDPICHLPLCLRVGVVAGR